MSINDFNLSKSIEQLMIERDGGRGEGPTKAGLQPRLPPRTDSELLNQLGWCSGVWDAPLKGQKALFGLPQLVSRSTCTTGAMRRCPTSVFSLSLKRPRHVNPCQHQLSNPCKHLPWSHHASAMAPWQMRGCHARVRQSQKTASALNPEPYPKP